MNSVRLACLTVLSVCVSALSVAAQEWPARPITIIVGYAPGGSLDVLARATAENVAKELKIPIVIENRAGGGGLVAENAVMHAAPDGYTLLAGAIATVLRPLIDQTATFEPLSAFTPIVLLGDTPNIILAGKNHVGGTLRDLVAHAKQNPKGLTLGHPGLGTMGHLATEFLTSYAELEATLVAYRSGPQMVPDLVEGRIDAGVAAFTPGMTSAKILAVMSSQPVKFLPDVKTTAEAGFPGLEATTWFALFGPPALPSDIVEKINKATNDYLSSAAANMKLQSIGIQALGGTPGDLKSRMRQDIAHWSKIISQKKIKSPAPQ